MNTKPNVLIESLDERWDKYRAELKNCKKEFSKEAVHDLRVAARRLMALLNILRILDPHPRIQKVRRVFKNQLDALDDLRDTQVMLVEVSESMANFPELQAFEKNLLSREKKFLRKARKESKDLGVSEVKKRIEKSRNSLEEKAKEEDIEVQLLAAVDQAYAEAMQAFGQIEASQPASIHRFRIKFKKFRYMVEVVHSALKDYPEAYFEQMRNYQGRMGDIQDSVVFLNILTEYAEQTESLDALASVQEAFENKRAESIAKFMERKNEIHVFWRSAPDQKLPWEKTNEPVHRPSRNRSGGGNIRIRKRQSASTDRQGQKENAEDRAGVEGAGVGNQPDPHQSVPPRRGDGEDSEESV